MKTIQLKHISEQEIIDACRAYRNKVTATPDISLDHKYPVKLIMMKMRKMVDKGILNYGTSLRTAWVVSDVEIA